MHAAAQHYKLSPKEKHKEITNTITGTGNKNDPAHVQETWRRGWMGKREGAVYFIVASPIIKFPLTKT